MGGARSGLHYPLFRRGDSMSSEIIVVLVMVALAIAGLGYLEMNSRRHKATKKEEERTIMDE
jgi:hypothetical protein